MISSYFCSAVRIFCGDATITVAFLLVLLEHPEEWGTHGVKWTGVEGMGRSA